MQLKTMADIARELGIHPREVSTACRLLGLETCRVGRAIAVNDRQYKKLRPHLERLRNDPQPATAAG